MPRRADEKNEAGRAATERWRKGLRARGAPEACHVDTAVAAAVAVALAKAQSAGQDIPDEMKSVISDALKLLKIRGYDGSLSTKAAMRRLLARRDRSALVSAVSGKRKSVSTGQSDFDISPHYFAIEKRENLDSRSDAGDE